MMVLRILGYGLVVTMTSAAYGSTTALAEEPRTATLAWTRGEGATTCADVRMVARAVETRLSREVFVSPARAELLVDGTVSRNGDHWHVSVAMSDASGAALGTREFDEAQASCDGVTNSIALVLSLMIDPEAEVLVAAPAQADRPPVAAPAVEAPPQAPPPLSTPPRERMVPREDNPFSFAGGAVLGMGMFPRLGAGAAIRVGVDVPRFTRVDFEARLFPGMDINTSAAPSARLTQATGVLALCPLLASTRAIAVRGCAGVELGAIQSLGLRFNSNARQTDLVANALLRANLAVRLVGHLALHVGVTGGVALVRHSFVGQDSFDVSSELYKTGLFFGSAEVLLGLDFF